MKKILLALLPLLIIVQIVAAQVPDMQALSPIFQTLDTVFMLFVVIYIVIDVFKLFRLYRKEGIVFLKFFKSPKAIISIIITLVGVAIFIAGMLQPWYSVSADVKAGPIDTGGLKKIIAIDGINGATVDKTLTGGLELPKSGGINTILLLIVISSIFGLIGAKSLRRFGWSNIKSGAFTLIFFFVVIALIMFLPDIVNALMAKIPIASQNVLVKAFVTDFTKTVASSPFSGEYAKNITIPVQAHLKILWSFEIGMYLFLVAGVIKIIGGVLAILFSGEVKTKDDEDNQKKNKDKKR